MRWTHCQSVHTWNKVGDWGLSYISDKYCIECQETVETVKCGAMEGELTVEPAVGKRVQCEESVRMSRL